MILHTINQYLDMLYTRYNIGTIEKNDDLSDLQDKLSKIKKLYGGKQLITPEGRLKELIEIYLKTD
jgi:hypothetical protein